jgi:hypothetical protein
MAVREEDALKEYHKEVKKLLHIKNTDIISSFSDLINAHDSEFWKILDMFGELPAPVRTRLILLALDAVESELYEGKG